MLARLSRWVHLEPGDVLGCGTGAGVGRLHEGDQLAAWLDGAPGTRREVRIVQGPPR
ncbi:MAG: fumarylacetoacetate hydrolase family protein [Candidatus Thermoplasmatota archaeon]|nr:fumarylacetoacetate hydrolase family protein [Candidatus Thermoplasmatota archaeon]